MTPAEMKLRLLAHWQSGTIEAALGEASAVLDDAGSPLALRQAVRDFLRARKVERRIAARIEHFADFVPDIDAARKNPFLSAPSTGPFPFVSPVVSSIARLNGIAPDDQEFQDRIHWGSGAHRQMVFLHQLKRQLNAKSKVSLTDQEKTALDIIRTLNGALVLPDLTPILSDIKAGQSVVLVQAHAGMSTVSQIGLPIGEMPLCTISAHAPPARRPQDMNLAVAVPGVALGFARLLKFMRKEAGIVRIFADGAHGEMMPGSILGCDIEIGRGAALLAFGGKASVYYCGSRWTGRVFEFFLTPGPKGDAYPSKPAFEAAFTDFYCSCLEKVVSGPPEDMAPNGGFWRFFRE